MDEERLRAQAGWAYGAVREPLKQADEARAKFIYDYREAGAVQLDPVLEDSMLGEYGRSLQAFLPAIKTIRGLTTDLLRSHQQEAVATAGREWGTGDAHAVFARVAAAAHEALGRQYAELAQIPGTSTARGCYETRAVALNKVSLRVHGYLREMVNAYGRYLIAVAPTPHPQARRFPAVGLDDRGRSQVMADRTGTAFVLGHGSDPNTGNVPVPQGRSVSFYADLDMSTLMSVTQAVLTAGDILPRQTYHAGQNIPNYRLSKLNDEETATESASVSDRLPGKLYQVGADWPLDDSPLRLCTTRRACLTPDRALGYEPFRSTQHHPGCKGLFNLLAEADLHLFICRRSPGAPRVETRAMDVRRVPAGKRLVDGRGRPVTRTTPYGHEPDAYDTSLDERVAAIFEWAAVDLAAAVTYVHSLPQATLAALRQRSDFELWLACTQQHTPDPRQAQAVADTLLLLDSLAQTAAVHWWRALPPATRAVLRTMPDVPDCLGRLGEPVVEPHRDRTPAPAEFSAAWADVDWRNAFITWLIAAIPTPPQQPVLTLYALLHPITSPGDTDGITMTSSGFGARADLTDAEVLPAAEHIVDYCHGSHGHIPALDEPWVLDTLTTNLHDSTLATNAGYDRLRIDTPDVIYRQDVPNHALTDLIALIRQDLERLDTSLTEQFDYCYQAYRQSLGL